MTFPLYNELVPASTVAHAVWAHLVPDCVHFPYLVTVRNGSIDVYEVSQDIAELQGAPLQLVTSSSLQDDITDIKVIRFTGSLLKKLMSHDSSVASIDVLMLCFPGGKVSIIALDPFSLTFKTLVMLNFEPDGLNPGAAVFPPDTRIVHWGASARGNIAVDPEGQCACISPASDVLAIMPIRKDIEGLSIFSEGEMNAGWSTAATDLPIFSSSIVSNESKVIDEQDMLSAQFMRKPYLIHMSDLGGAPDGTAESGSTGYEGGNGIADMAFLNSGGVSSTLAVLVHSRNTSVSRTSSLLHTSSIVVLNVDTGGYTSAKPSILWKKDGLPHDAFALVPVSTFIGGVLVITSSAILYFNETEYYGLAVNGYAAYTVNCLYRYKLHTNADAKPSVPPACVDLSDSRVTPLTPDAFLVVTSTGYAHLLRLHVDANIVRGMSLQPAASILANAPTSLIVPLVDNRRLIQQYIIRLQQRSSRKHNGAHTLVLPSASAGLLGDVSSDNYAESLLQCGLVFMTSVQTRPILFAWWLESTDERVDVTTASAVQLETTTHQLPGLSYGIDEKASESSSKSDPGSIGFVTTQQSIAASVDDDLDLYSVTPATVAAVPVSASDNKTVSAAPLGQLEDLDDLYSVPKLASAPTGSPSALDTSANDDSLYAVSSAAAKVEATVDTIFSTTNLSLRITPMDSFPSLSATSASTIGKRGFLPSSVDESAKYHAPDNEYVVSTGQYGNGGVAVVRSTIPYDILNVMEFEGCFHSWHVPLTSPTPEIAEEEDSATGYFFFAMKDNTTRVLEVADGVRELGGVGEQDQAQGVGTDANDESAGTSSSNSLPHFIMEEITLFACALPGNRIFQLTQSSYVVVEYSYEDRTLRRLFDPVPIGSIYSSYSVFDMTPGSIDSELTVTPVSGLDQTSQLTMTPSVVPHKVHVAAMRDLNGFVVAQDTHGRLFYADFLSNLGGPIENPTEIFRPLLLTPGHPTTAFFLGYDREASDVKRQHSFFPSTHSHSKSNTSGLPYLLVARRCGTIELYDLCTAPDTAVFNVLPILVWTLKGANLHPRLLIPTGSQTDLSATFLDARQAARSPSVAPTSKSHNALGGASSRADPPKSPKAHRSPVPTVASVTKRARAPSVSSVSGISAKLSRTDSHSSERSYASHSSSVSALELAGDSTIAEAVDTLMSCMEEEADEAVSPLGSPILGSQPNILNYSAPASPVPLTYVTDLAVIIQRGGKKVLVLCTNTQQVFSYAWKQAGAKYGAICSDVADLVDKEKKSYIFPTLSKVSRFVQIPSGTLLAKTLDNAAPIIAKEHSIAIPFPPFQPYLTSQVGTSFVQYPAESWTQPLVESPYRQAMLRPFASLSGWSGCFVASKLPHLMLAHRGAIYALPLSIPIGAQDHFPTASPTQSTLQLLRKDPLRAFTPFTSKFCPEGVLLTQEYTTTFLTLHGPQWDTAPFGTFYHLERETPPYQPVPIHRRRIVPLGMAICAYTAKPLSAPPSHVASQLIRYLTLKGTIPVPSVYSPPTSTRDSNQTESMDVDSAQGQETEGSLQTWQPLEDMEEDAQESPTFQLLTSSHTEFGTYACMYYPMHRSLKHICYLNFTSSHLGQSMLQTLSEREEEASVQDSMQSPRSFTPEQKRNANYPLYVATLVTPVVRNYEKEVIDLHRLLESQGGEYMQFNYGPHVDWAKLPLEDASVENSFEGYGSAFGVDATRGKSMWNSIVDTFRRGRIDVAPPVLGSVHSIALIHGSADESGASWHLLDQVELEPYEKITCMQEVSLGVGSEGEFEYAIAVGTCFQTHRGEGGKPEGRILLFGVTRVVTGNDTNSGETNQEQDDFVDTSENGPSKNENSSVDNPSAPEVSPVSNVEKSELDIHPETGDPVTLPDTDESTNGYGDIKLEENNGTTHHATTIPKLRLIHAETISRAYVQAMAPLSVINENGVNERHLVISIGRRIQVHGWQASHSRLRMIGFYDLFTSATSLATAKEFIIVGDAHKSVTFLRWRNPDKQLLFLASDPLPLPIAAVGTTAHTNRLEICAADVEGNMTMYKYDPVHSGKELVTTMDIHTGHVVSTAAVAHAPITIAVPTLLSGRDVTSITSTQSAFRQALMVANTNGCIAMMQPLLESDYKRLLALQRLILLCFPQVAGVNPRLSKMFQSLSQPFRDTVSRKQGILYSPILRTFLSLSAVVQDHLSDAIGSSVERVLLTLRNIHAEASQF